MTKIYVGARRNGDAQVTVTDDRGTRELEPRLDLRNHSPDGFECGYHGSGPAQLALAICADVLGDDARAQRVYQTFKARRIAPIQSDDFAMLGGDVESAVNEIETEQEKRSGVERRVPLHSWRDGEVERRRGGAYQRRRERKTVEQP